MKNAVPECIWSPVCRISMYEWFIEGKRILSVADLVCIDEELPLSLETHSITRDKTMSHKRFAVLRFATTTSHRNGRPAGVQHEAE